MREVRDDVELHEPLLDAGSTPAEMPHLHRILLSPWEKWARHGRFPWKLLCHVLLVICCMAQIFVYDAQNSAYIRASYRNWVYFFLPSGPSMLAPDEYRFHEPLYSINASIAAIQNVRDAYYAIAGRSVANYEYHYMDAWNSTPVPIAVAVTQVLRGETTVTRYNLTATSLGPLDNATTPMDVAAFFHTLSRMEFHLRLRDMDYGPLYFDCFDWDVHIAVDKIHASHLRYVAAHTGLTSHSMMIEPSHLHICSSEGLWKAIRHRYLWLNVVILVIGVVYLVLSVKSLMRSVQMFAKAKRFAHEALAHPEDAGLLQSWHDVPLAIKLQFFKTQYLFISAAIVLVSLNSVWNISRAIAFVPLSESHRVVQALGPLLLCATLVGYLEHNPHFYSIVLTLRWGIPKVLYFLTGVSPIFFGYAVFGSIAFGDRVDGFGGLQQSCITLFSIMNGDIILDSFDALKADFPILGAAYLYSFIALFIYIVLNIFIAIVEESYFATRSYKRALDVLSQGLFAGDSNAQQQRLTADAFRILLRVLEHTPDAPPTAT
ncbi:mucolipin-like protein [Achlya hypogyna]|uniref:Mucolipin-like protein n=1 Tax=Achlya hypogyna TaxID=1202772 RepID=A0A1V9Z637_ACHHY|nr:mucolipin-like protein [Achlya hypogyna]